MKTALITGSAGFVGRHFDRYLSGRGGWLLFRCDIRDGRDALELFRTGDRRFDLVVHCAAVVGGRQVIDGDPLAQAACLELDAAMFRWAQRTQPGRVIYFSSSAAYPRGMQTSAARTELAEDDISPELTALITGVPDQLYGWAKLTGETLAVRARRAGVPVTVVRPFSGYGEDQALDYPFPSFIRRAVRREDPFTIWGDGQQVRDFIHIDDIVNAAMLMAEQGMDGPVNLGWGRPVTMLELAAMVCGAAGYSPEVKPLESRPSGVSYRVADNARLLEFYTPQVCLEEGVRRALAPYGRGK